MQCSQIIPLTHPPRVAVIGAGAAGLAALSVLHRKFDVTAFEFSDRVGVWNYRRDPLDTQGGCSCPVYHNLTTNLPKEVMAFPDWEWRLEDASASSFLTHQQVLAYLQSYCYDQGLDNFVRFSRRVVSVRRAETSRAWVVETLEDGVETYDAVVIANGHFSKAMIPELLGLADFPLDRVSHSCTYRYADTFSGQVVALLGASSSGQDIALELAGTAKQVLLCHRGPVLPSALPDNVRQLGPIVELFSDGSILCRCLPCRSTESSTVEDLVKVQVDHVMFCTGYDYDFPFIDRSCVPTESSNVPRLFMQVAHCDHPGLYFLGLCTMVVPFPQFYLQAKVVESLLEARSGLPENASVASERELAEKLAAGVTPRHLHTLGDQQWDYNDRLADFAGCPRLPRVVGLIYDHVKAERRLRLIGYKRLAYRITGPDTFECFRST